MAERPWDQQKLIGFLKRAGEELRRTGEELRAEAQRVLEQVRDPENQQKVKENLQEFGSWARKTAGDAAVMIDSAVQKLETTLRTAADKARPGTAPEPWQGAEKERADSSEDAPTVKERVAAAEPQKGKGKAGGKGSKGARAGAGKSRTSKTIGRKKG